MSARLSLIVIFSLIAGTIFFATTSGVLAAGQPKFVSLSGFTGVTTDQPSLSSYLTTLFRIAISVGALLAVVKITFAGIKYMTTGAFSSKEDAKKDITAALLGLLILLSVVIILQTINPQILNLNILGSANNNGGSDIINEALDNALQQGQNPTGFTETSQGTPTGGSTGEGSSGGGTGGGGGGGS